MKTSTVVYIVSFAIEGVAWLVLWHGRAKEGRPPWVRWGTVVTITVVDALLLQSKVDINEKFLISLLLLLMAGRWLYGTRWMEAILRTLAYAGCLVAGDVLGALASLGILGISSLHQLFTAPPDQQLIWVSLSKGLLLLLCLVGNRILTPRGLFLRGQKETLLPMGLLCTNLLLVIGIFQFLFTYAVGQDTRALLWILLPILAGQGLLLYLIHYMNRQQEKIKGIEIQEALSQEKEAYYLQQMADYEAWSLLAHDMAKHQQALAQFQSTVADQGRVCVSRQEIEQLRDYSSSLQEEIRQLPKVVQTGLFSLDMLLTAKAKECQSKGIRMEVALWGQALRILSASDCNALFANLLDNAVEGCEASDSPSPWIALRGDIRGDRYVCYLRNSCQHLEDVVDWKKGELPPTTKTDKEHHGYGLKSIISIVESHGGSVSWRGKGNVFTVLFHLPLEKTDHPG